MLIRRRRRGGRVIYSRWIIDGLRRMFNIRLSCLTSNFDRKKNHKLGMDQNSSIEIVYSPNQTKHVKEEGLGAEGEVEPVQSIESK